MNDLVIRYLGSAEAVDTRERDRIGAGLVAAMPQHEVASYLTAKPHILAFSDHLVTTESADGCIGLIAASEYTSGEMSFIHIETLLVGERYQGSGVSSGLVRVLFAGVVNALGNFPDTVAMKTYTPKAYLMMRRFALGGDIVFTPLIDAARDEPGTLRAERLARSLSPDCRFDGGTGVIRGGGGQIGNRFWHYEPLCSDPAVNDFFHREVGEHDRVLCVIHAPTESAKDSLLQALRVTPPWSNKLSLRFTF